MSSLLIRARVNILRSPIIPSSQWTTKNGTGKRSNTGSSIIGFSKRRLLQQQGGMNHNNGGGAFRCRRLLLQQQQQQQKTIISSSSLSSWQGRGRILRLNVLNVSSSSSSRAAASTMTSNPSLLLRIIDPRHTRSWCLVNIPNSYHASSTSTSTRSGSHNNNNNNKNNTSILFPVGRQFGTSSSSSPKVGPSPPSHNDDDDGEETSDKTSSSKDATSSSSTTTTTSDPSILTWVDDYLPISIQPYAKLARIDKPIGTWLLLWPCFWSTAIAAEAGQYPDIQLLSLFTVGAIVMRGAGCTINDMWDSEFDKRVTRTISRPLASGDITHIQALGFLACQLSIGLSVLLSLPNTMYCFIWGASSLPLVIIYPLMKRYTNWPQLVLGLTFNWGAWMGYAATYGTMDYSIIGPLYGAGVTWTLVYDTIYANQDKTDDKALGLKSTALTFGSNIIQHKLILHTFAVLTYSQWLLAGYNTFCPSSLSLMDDFNFIIYGIGVTSAYTHLIWQIYTADLNNPYNLAKRFRSNTQVGGIIFISIVAGKVVGSSMSL